MFEIDLAARIRDARDKVRFHPVTTRLEDAIGAHEFPEAGFLAAEGNGGERFHLAVDAEALCKGGDAFGIGFVAKLCGDGVGGAGERFGQRHRPMILAVIVYRLPFADGDAPVIEHVIGRVAIFQCEGIDEGLEAGAGLALGLGDAVEGRGGIVHAAGEGDDGAVAVKDEGGDLAGGNGLAILGHPLTEQCLRLLLDFRIDGQLDDGISRHARQQGFQALGGDIKRVAKLGIVAGRRDDVDGRFAGGGGFLFGDVALAFHFLQHIELAGFGAFEIFPQVELGRGLGQRGQEGGFMHLKLCRGLAEIETGGRVDAVEPGAEIDAVEIEGEDLILRHALFELAGEGDFLRLALHGLAAVENEVFHQLLGDGGSARDGFTGSGIGDGRAGDGGLIGAVMFIEAFVFGRDEGLGDMLGQLCHINRPAIAGPADGKGVALRIHKLDGSFTVCLPQLGHFRQAGHARMQALPFPECPGAAAEGNGADGDEQDAQRAEPAGREGLHGNADDPWHAGGWLAVGHA